MRAEGAQGDDSVGGLHYKKGNRQLERLNDLLVVPFCLEISMLGLD